MLSRRGNGFFLTGRYFFFTKKKELVGSGGYPELSILVELFGKVHSNRRPPACEADVMPLDHKPLNFFRKEV